jgi:hypothetical protein
MVIKVSQHSYIVFITHWPDIAMQLKNKYPNIQLVTLYPKTDEDLLWQINTYIDKIGIENLQNFSFTGDTNKQKADYIEQHGVEEYYKFNVLNMFEIMKERASSYQNLSAHQIAICELHGVEWINQLRDFLNIELELEQAYSLVNTWHALHQPIGNNTKWSKHIYESN